MEFDCRLNVVGVVIGAGCRCLLFACGVASLEAVLVLTERAEFVWLDVLVEWCTGHSLVASCHTNS